MSLKNKVLDKIIHGMDPRVAIVEVLGNKCSTCSYSNPAALKLTHPEAGEFRKQAGNYYRYRDWLIQHFEEKGYRVLCANCIEIEKVARELGRHKLSIPTPIYIYNPKQGQDSTVDPLLLMKTNYPDTNVWVVNNEIITSSLTNEEYSLQIFLFSTGIKLYTSNEVQVYGI